MNLKRILVITLLMCSFSYASQANEESPGKIVKQTIDQVLSVLNDKNLEEDKRKNIVYKLVKERINFKEMSRRILALNWHVASEEQKTEFVSLFEEILLNTYWSRIKQYAGERVEYIKVSSVNEDYATVDTIIVRNKTDKEIPISYRMKRFISVWLAYDFTVEGLSLVQSYRNGYHAIAKNHGVDGLLEHMRREIAAHNTNT